MVHIKPLRAIRPAPDTVAAIASLPYDVVSEAEARTAGSENEKSFLHIDRSEIDLPESVPADADKVYEQAAANLERFMEKGWLIKDTAPSYYIYRLTWRGKSQSGLVLGASVEDYDQQLIKKHEFTRPEKELDRIRHMDACDAHTSPIFLTYRDESRVLEHLEQYTIGHQPLYDFTGFYDVRHTVWRIEDEHLTETITAEFLENVPALYIADGHHRTESSVKVARMREQEADAKNENAEYKHFLAVAFAESELNILPYNRLVKGALTAEGWQLIRSHFEIAQEQREPVIPGKKGEFGLYAEGKWYRLSAKPLAGAVTTVERLDVSLLQDHILTPVFGIRDPRTDKRIDFVGGIREVKELEQRADAEGAVAFTLYPTSIEELFSVADAGNVMPPKSTWFEPKLLSGLFLHDLETKKRQ